MYFWSCSGIHFCFSVSAALRSDLRRGTDKYFVLLLLFIQSCFDITDSTETENKGTRITMLLTSFSRYTFNTLKRRRREGVGKHGA